ncbi:hypothetical protein IH981_03675, partial [Patescibacteria group bacterium]|nr:hypothetical protein [Patescibacteria group bacterium]
MKRLEFKENQKLADVLKAIDEESEKEIEIFIYPGGDVLKVPTNIEMINSLAESLGKKVVIKGDFEAVPKEPVVKEPEENLGFVEGKDVATQKEPPTEKKGVLSFLKLPHLKLPKGRKRIYLIAGAVVLTFVIGASVVWFVPKAEVTLITETQFKEAELSLIASAASDEVDIDKGIVPLKNLETTQEDVLESKATGAKTVGTPSKGRVKIVNRDTSGGKSFFKGNTITTVAGSKVTFTLDKSATVSAAPVGCEPCPSAGVDVTATSIGDSGNLASGTVFKVGSADVNLVFAKNETNFTGGSSKKLTVVSSEDQKKTKEELLEKLETSAIEELEKDDPDIVVPEGGLEAKILNEVYSKK